VPGIARLNDEISHGGHITGASQAVRADGRRVARLGDTVQCDRHGAQTITGASPDVRADGRRVARLGDVISCGATITTASTRVRVNGP
jgi:uncharacterized Zn-binding protein involved in type VI secretion